LEPWERQWTQKVAPSGQASPSATKSEPWKRQWESHKPSQAAESETLQEMHPAFSKADRFVVKTFGNDTEAAIQSLQKSHPDLEITKNEYTEQIKARTRGKNEPFRVLDPDTGFFSSDFVNDVTDVAGDVGTGVATTGLTALGALAGGAAGAAAGGIGAVPGALAGGAAAGGLSAAALEALRQAAGVGLGVNQEVKGDDIAWAGGTGVLSPLLFGGGATASQVAAKAAGKGWMTYANPFLGAKEGVKNLAKSTVRTGLSKTPFMKGLAQHVPANVDQSMPALLARYGSEGAEGLANTLTKSQSGVPGHIFGKFKRSTLPKVAETTSGIQADVIRNYADNPDAIENLTKGGVRNLMVDTIDSTKGTMGKRRREIGDLMNTARTLADDMADMADLAGSPDEAMKYKVQTSDVMQPFQELMEQLEEAAKIDDTEIDQDAAKAVSEIYRKYFVKEVVTTGQTAFGAPLVQQTVRPAMKASEAFRLKQKLLKLAKFNPSDGFKSGLPKGADHVQQDIIMAAREAIGRIDDQLDQITKTAGVDGAEKLGIPLDPDFSYRFAQDEYSMLEEDEKLLGQLLRNPRQAHNTLSNLGNKTNRTNMEGVMAIDAKYGTNLAKTSKELAAHRAFSDAPWLAMSGGGTTSTSRTVPLSDSLGGLFYYLGANSGLGQGGAGIGASFGQALGGVLGGPAAIKRYLRMNKAVGKGKGLMRDAALAPNRVLTPWSLMEQRSLEE